MIVLDLAPLQLGPAMDQVGGILLVGDDESGAPTVIASKRSWPERKVLARGGALVLQADRDCFLKFPFGEPLADQRCGADQ